MFGSAYYLIGVLALVVLQPSASFDLSVASSVCNLLQNGELIASGSSCGQYYQCQNGVATAMSCGSGYYFSKDVQGCVYSTGTDGCGDSILEPCAGVADGTFVSVPGACAKFYYCSGGVGTMGSCGTGLNFDASQQSCNYTINVPCTDSPTTDTVDGSGNINLCAVIENNVYFAGSASCATWQVCQNNVLTVGTCDSPYYFNVDTGACDYQDNVSCRQNNGDSNIDSDPSYLNGQPCSFSGFVVSDNLTCAGYYSCNGGVYSYSSCPGGLYFNPPSQTCVNRLNAINNCNRCQGTKLQFVNLYEDDCVGYGYCSNGHIASTGTCSDGYFDEVAQACVVGEAEPQYAVCNTVLSGVTTAAPGVSPTSAGTGTTSTDTTSSDASSSTTETSTTL